jgi:ribosomal protein L11 methyltransferase
VAAVVAFMEKLPGASVLDVGTGTGVLAIAARKLGATHVMGVDNDEVSVTLALENAATNHVDGLALSGKTLSQIPGTFDLVLANILANTLIELAPAIAEKVKQRLVLAGVLVHQRSEVEAAYVAQGLKPAGHETIGEWIRLDFER